MSSVRRVPKPVGSSYPTGPAGPRRLGPALVVGIGGAALAVAAVLSPAAVDHGPDVCPFRIMTGLPCPGCGLTRSWTHLMHGDVAGAIALNVFGPITMAVTAIAVVLAVWRLMAGPAALARLRLGRLMPYALAVVGIWLVYGVARIIDAAAGWGLFPTVV
ncbi:DUF2752 domain-containing protein [Gordonia otitidis]|nr:DUF2752 domain-containing protein [Gordonia otitidis]UEA58283.1 DUF2752 domain-containing protein [Gordonia otitidis]